MYKYILIIYWIMFILKSNCGPPARSIFVFLIYLCKIQFMATDNENTYLYWRPNSVFFYLLKCLYEQKIYYRPHMKYIYDISVFRENIVFSTSKRPNKRMPIRPGCIKGIKRKKKTLLRHTIHWMFTDITRLHPLYNIVNVFLHTPKAALASHERPIKYNYLRGSSWARQKYMV